MYAFRAILSAAVFAQSVIAARPLKVRGDKPQYFTDPATSKYCTWYHDNADDSIACADVPALYGISKDEFLRWVSKSPLCILTGMHINSFDYRIPLLVVIARATTRFNHTALKLLASRLDLPPSQPPRALLPPLLPQ
jgi:hypothetical protein